MELLVLSTLKWWMHPLTPISFFEHIVRRLGLKSCLHWEFMWRCERVLLHVIVGLRQLNPISLHKHNIEISNLRL
ncbi:CYCLIN D3-2 [Trifolium repens]|nr:CYCLIN D3-2 [Trifolium repens]